MDANRIFKPLSREFLGDPYPTYAALRREYPVFYNRVLRSWIVTRYRDASQALRHPDLATLSLGQERDFWGSKAFASGDLKKVQSKWLFFLDPPDHTRLRGLVRSAFTPRRIEKMRGDVQKRVDDLLDPLVDQGGMDVIGDFAYTLPVQVICDLLGVPSSEIGPFHAWSQAMAGTLDPVLSADVVKEGNEAATAFQEYFTELIAARRSSLTDDLISGLIRVEEEGERLTVDEMISTAVMLFVAGHETTMNLIGNGLKALLENPDQMEILRRDRSAVPTAVEEFLRYDSPVQLTGRQASSDLTLGGQEITADSFLIIFLGSANRDEEYFSNGEQLDVRRPENPHFAFGGGVHFCLGATLARVEAITAFNSLLNLSKIEFAGEPVRRRTINVRGLESFPVSLTR